MVRWRESADAVAPGAVVGGASGTSHPYAKSRPLCANGRSGSAIPGPTPATGAAGEWERGERAVREW
mgnify:CR=1 FL=1